MDFWVSPNSEASNIHKILNTETINYVAIQMQQILRISSLLDTDPAKQENTSFVR